MTKIVILGGGFAGLAAADIFCKFNFSSNLLLIDKKSSMDFLPMLPDCIGKNVNPKNISYNLSHIARSKRFKFIQDEVLSLDLTMRKVFCRNNIVEYDYLLIATGSEINFYGNLKIADYAFTIESVTNIMNILRSINRCEFDSFIVCGGGYTGVEVASNLVRYCKKFYKDAKIIIVEKAPTVLNTLPDWIKIYVRKNLARLNIKIYTDTTVTDINENQIILSNGKIFNNSMLIWTAGVKTAEFIQNSNLPKNPQGRIIVDEYLQADERVFVAGDVAFFIYKNSPLRMAVQFAIQQGRCAAYNIIKSINRKPLKKYKPLDLGYIIPMANNISCGRVLGFNLKGHLPTVLHYFMCIYRTYGIKNKIRIIKDLFFDLIFKNFSISTSF